MNYELFFLACALNLFYYVPNLLASPITGGKKNTNTYKYLVFIQRNFIDTEPNSGATLCTGTIIHPRYVLSIAHPFLKLKKVLRPSSNGIVVLAGTSEIHSSGIIKHVDKIFIPGEYNSGSYADISVLKLKTRLNMNGDRKRLQTLRVYPGNDALDFFVNKPASTVVGNGCDTAANKRHSLEVHVSPKETCPSEFTYAICTVNHDISYIDTPCKGDGGSPIVYNNTVIGVLFEAELECPGRRLNMLFTRTSTFIAFIQNVVNEKVDPNLMQILEN